MLAIKWKVNKNKKEDETYKVNWGVTLIVLILLIIYSIGLIYNYGLIENIAKENMKKNYSVFNNNNLKERIYSTNYGIYFDTIEKEANSEGKSINLVNEFFSLEDNKNHKEAKDYEERVKEDESNLNNYIKERIESLNFLENLEVYAINSSGKTVFNSNKEQEWMLEALAKGEKIEKKDLNDYFRFCVVIKFDDRGKITIEDAYGENDFNVRKNLSNYSYRYSYDGRVVNDYELKPIKNMTYVYAVPKELKYKDSLYASEINQWYYEVNDASLIFIMIAVCLALILAVIIPFRYSKNILGFKTFKKIPLEINFVLLSILIALIVESGNILIVSTLEGGLREVYKTTNIPFLYKATYILNFAYWIFLLGALLYEVVYVKYIFNSGFKNFLKNHCIIYKLKNFILDGIKKCIKYIKKIDLNKKSDKLLLILVGINFIIVSILCSMWFVGIIGAVVYSIILFHFGRKYFNKLKSDYNKILDKTREIAHGNLELTKNEEKEDMGLFNPLNEELNHIKNGFKKAVDEEVKSQKMKTELISNVSHDLKTPLTSIIAYVDLLKNEKDEEKRKAYLETLDKKSQRLKFLIEDLFEVSKATSGNISLNLMDIDISYLLRQVIVELDDKISEAGLDFRLNLPDKKVVLKLDNQRTYRIFENLIINVVKYAMKNSRVYVDINESESDVEIIIKNISENEITFNSEEISDRFVRGDKSRNTEGSGLGLAIVKSFVEIQGGMFKVEVDGDLFKAIINFKLDYKENLI